MKRLGLLVVVAACACFGETLFDIDFGSASNRVDAERKGSFHGVLPRNVNENYSAWRGTRCSPWRRRALSRISTAIR